VVVKWYTAYLRRGERRDERGERSEERGARKRREHHYVSTEPGTHTYFYEYI
jgi:hypothetical protein